MTATNVQSTISYVTSLTSYQDCLATVTHSGRYQRWSVWCNFTSYTIQFGS